MVMELDRKELHENYEALQAGTGESWESIAGRVEAMGDKDLAAELRRKHSADSKGDEKEARKEEPKARRSTANKPVTASGTDK